MSEIMNNNQNSRIDTTELVPDTISDKLWREFTYRHALSLTQQYAGSIALEGMPRSEVEGVES